MTTKTEYPKRDVIQEINDEICAALAQGVKKWGPPFDPAKAVDPQLPFNPIPGKAYRGTNSILLAISPHFLGTGDPRFCGFVQGKNEGWRLRKGERSTGIIYVPQKTVQDEASPDDEHYEKQLAADKWAFVHAAAAAQKAVDKVLEWRGTPALLPSLADDANDALSG